MSTSSPDDRGPQAVRLTWPGTRAADEPEARAAGEAPGEQAGPDGARAPRDRSDLWAAADAASRPAGPAGFDDRSPWPVEVVAGDTGASAAMRRAVVDAYDRFADRVLGRLRDMHEQVDADLAELRSEVAALRRAVDDVGDRVQLRQLRSSIDDLRSDVAGLRRAVLEWPELERVSSDVTAIRADLSDLAGRAPGGPDAGHPGDAPLTALGPLLDELGTVRAELERLTGAEGSSLGDELAGLRADVTALRRRIALRAGGGTELAPEQVDQLADRVIERLLAALDTGR